MKQFQMLGYKMLQVTVEYTKNKSMDHTVSYSCFYLNKDGRKISDSTSERTKLINFFRLYLAFHSNNNINVWHGIFELPVFFLYCGIFDLPHLQISIRKAIECVTDVRSFLSRQNKIKRVNMFIWSSTIEFFRCHSKFFCSSTNCIYLRFWKLINRNTFCLLCLCER